MRHGEKIPYIKKIFFVNPLFSFAQSRYDAGIMIGSLEGTIEFIAEKFIFLNVHGVGYKIFCGASTLDKMPKKDAVVKLWIHYHVREDSHELYGFFHYGELDLFELLIAISGIGPKGALGILNIAPVDTLKKAIAAGDTSYLTRVSGIGKKIAEKVILELREKMSGRGVLINAPELQHEADALEALMGLGYSQREAREALSGAGGDPPANGNTGSVEERVKRALRSLGKKQ
jgi:Holliday junction DNA helicase RuvA